MATVEDKLTALATLSQTQLRAEWLRLYRATAPRMTADLLRRGIAFRLQHQAHGSYTPSTLREIDRLARQFERTGEAAPAAPNRIKPGTRLVRDWGGESHHVLILDRAYLYRDQSYGSLTEIARLITGARWSGPRFFGLKTRKSAEDKANA